MALLEVLRRPLRVKPLASSVKTALSPRQYYQTRTLWVRRPLTVRSPEGRDFFPRRDVHVHTREQLPKTWKWARRIAIGGASLITLSSAVAILLEDLTPIDLIRGHGDAINFDRFVPYEVVSNRHVTATSFILTIMPKNVPKTPLPYLDADGNWWDFVWSVQVKQPELQIQREYTPLPPLDNDDGTTQAGLLRFYIRRVDTGEVSRYLGRLQPGDTVELRLAKPQYDFSYRHPSVPDRVSILASGTGIATALQIAHILLRDRQRLHHDTSVRLLWLQRDAAERYADTRMSEPDGPVRYDDRRLETEPDRPLTTIGVAIRQLFARDNGQHLSAYFSDCAEDEFARRLFDLAKVEQLKRRGASPPSYPAVLPRPMAASCGAAKGSSSPMDAREVAKLPHGIHAPYFVIGPEPFVERFAGRLVKPPGKEPRREGGILGYLVPKELQEKQGKDPGPAQFVVGMV